MYMKLTSFGRQDIEPTYHFIAITSAKFYFSRFMFSISAKKRIWSTLKRLELGGENKNKMDTESMLEIELDESLHSNFDLRGIEELEIESIDVSTFDPVTDFGFVVMGHEFDYYPKQMLRISGIGIGLLINLEKTVK